MTSSSLPSSSISPPPADPPPIPSSLCISPPSAVCSALASVRVFSACSASRFFFPWTFLSRKNSSLTGQLPFLYAMDVKKKRVYRTYRSASSSSELMYLIVLSSLGIMTCSMALTRRLVARMTSSRIVNAVLAVSG
jgi:hypothetical protein